MEYRDYKFCNWTTNHLRWKHDIWMIMDKLTKLSHFLAIKKMAIKKMDTADQLVQIYI